MRHFWVFRARARQNWSPSSAAGVARDGKDGENALTEASGCIIDGGQEAKMEILAYGTTMQTQGQIPLRKFGKTDARVAARRPRPRGRRRAPARCQLAFASSLCPAHRSQGVGHAAVSILCPPPPLNG